MDDVISARIFPPHKKAEKREYVSIGNWQTDDFYSVNYFPKGEIFAETRRNNADVMAIGNETLAELLEEFLHTADIGMVMFEDKQDSHSNEL